MMKVPKQRVATDPGDLLERHQFSSSVILEREDSWIWRLSEGLKDELRVCRKQLAVLLRLLPISRISGTEG